jgi:hypothetical protein
VRWIHYLHHSALLNNGFGFVALLGVHEWCQIIIFPKNLLAAVAEKMYGGDVTVVNRYKTGGFQGLNSEPRSGYKL